MAAAAPRFRRVLLKLSGEALMGPGAHGLDTPTLDRIAGDVKEAVEAGVTVAIVVGGGNIFRGVEGAAKGLERGAADYMGMLATVINALALKGALEAAGVGARVMSAIPMPTVCEPFQPDGALAHLDAGRVVVFAAGTGNPYFTTDTAAALRAAEIGADCLLKATQVDGVYSADPKHDPNAVRYATLTYNQVLAENLQVMDAAAIALARDNAIPVIVFAIGEAGGLLRVLRGDGRSTIIGN